VLPLLDAAAPLRLALLLYITPLLSLAALLLYLIATWADLRYLCSTWADLRYLYSTWADLPTSNCLIPPFPPFHTHHHPQSPFLNMLLSSSTRSTRGRAPSLPQRARILAVFPSWPCSHPQRALIFDVSSLSRESDDALVWPTSAIWVSGLIGAHRGRAPAF